jgi:hypothetical protein
VSAPTVSDLGALLGRTVTPEQGAASLQVVTAMASSYTRGQGFTADGTGDLVPNGEIRAVILTASARLLSNASGLLYDEAEGPSSISYRSAFQGWTVAESFVLNRYRVRAQ